MLLCIHLRVNLFKFFVGVVSDSSCLSELIFELLTLSWI